MLTIYGIAALLVGTRSLSSGAHSRDPLALPPYDFRVRKRAVQFAGVM